MPLNYYRIRITYLKFRGRRVIIFNDILFSKNTRCHDRDFDLTVLRRLVTNDRLDFWEIVK